VAPLDADDLWLPEKIELQVRRMEEAGPETGFVYSWWAWIDGSGTVLDRSPRWDIEGRVFEALLTVNFTGNASVPLFRRECLVEIGGYNPALADAKAGGCEDWEVVLRVANQWPIAEVKDVLLGYRRSSGSMSQATATMWRSKEMVFAGIRKLRPDLPEAMYVGANHQFAMYLAGVAYWAGDVLGAVRWALRAGKKLPVAVAPWALKMMLFRRGKDRQAQRMEPGKSINTHLIREPLLPYDRIRSFADLQDLAQALVEFPALLRKRGPLWAMWYVITPLRWLPLRVWWWFLRVSWPARNAVLVAAQLTVRRGILLRLWLEARANERRGADRPKRVMATACWHFPIYSQTFVYRELMEMMEGGFEVRFAYTGLKRRSDIPNDLAKVWGIRRKFLQANSLGLRDLHYYSMKMPKKVDALAKQIAQAAGMTETEVRAHRHFWYAFSFARMAQAWKAEYIHTYFFYEQAIYGLVAATLLDLPRGVSCYADHMLEDYELKMVGMHLRSCDVVVATSARIKGELEAIAGCELPQAFVKPNGIDTTSYTSRKGLSPGRVYKLVAVNRIHPKKGMTYLVEAAKELRDRGYRFRIDLLGEFDVFEAGTKEYSEELTAYVTTHGLESEVRFRGRQTAAQVREYLAEADVFLAPFVELANGDKDGIPTALLEGMAAGCAVVSTDAGSMLEVVRDGVEALLVPQCDAWALAEAIGRLLDDETLRGRLSGAAVERVKNHFDVRVCEPWLHERIREAISLKSPDPFRFKQTEELAPGKLRIGLLSFEYPPETGFGGIGTYTYYHARALARQGHEVIVLSGSRQTTKMVASEHDGVIVYRYRRMDAVMMAAKVFGALKCYWTKSRIENAWCMYLGMRELMKEHTFDVLEMPECGAEGVLINWLIDIPTVVRLHGPSGLILEYYDVPILDRFCCPRIEQIGLRSATVVTSCSEFLAQDTREELSLAKYIKTIPNGIDLKLFDAEPVGDLEALYGIPKGKVTVLFAGRMERRKGIHLCAAICERVLAHHDVTFLFAGEDLFGYMEGTMLPALAAKDLKGSVRYLGKLQLKELRAVAKAVDIYLLPSLWENMPYACLEAMAAGRAVVSSRQGGMPELVTDGVDGFLAELGSGLEADERPAKSFAAKLSLLIEDESLRTHFGSSARETIVRGFTDDGIAERTVEVYKGCIRVYRGESWLKE
jgi:glycosyltransferase involved in cell wall biosynthesis